MAQTVANLTSVMKDIWTEERVVKQFEAENQPLSRLEKLSSTMIGLQAQVPIHSGRAGGYTSVGPAGGNLNAAGNQPTAQATYTLVYNWHQVEFEAAVIAQAQTNAQSIIAAKDLELEGGLENTRHQMVRQLVTNGDGKVAACGTSGGANVVLPLTASASEGAAYGYAALDRGWLYPGALVDVGTTADTDALTTGATVSAVSLSATAPTITLSAAVDATAGTHFVYIANPNSATAANTEMNGLRSFVNTSGAFGGLNPGTAGQEFWQAAARDTTTTVFSLDLALALQRSVLQRSGKAFSNVWTSFKQQAAFYSLLQNQVRFSGDAQLGAGNVEGPSWNGIKVDAFADVLDTDWFCLTLSDLGRINAGWDAKWMSEMQGAEKGALWQAGTTQLKDALCVPFQLAGKRRNTCAAATALL